MPEQEFLWVRCSGDFSLPEAKAKFLLIMDAVVQHQIRKVMVDVRALCGSPTMFERFDYSTFVAQNAIRNAEGCRLAAHLVYLGDIPLIDPERFGETVARNRGASVKVYETREIKDAFAWLGVVPPDAALRCGE